MCYLCILVSKYYIYNFSTEENLDSLQRASSQLLDFIGMLVGSFLYSIPMDEPVLP